MIITNYGNNHSGKTTFSVALANKILETRHGSTVIILNFDPNVPAHAIWEPKREVSNMYSMGSLGEEVKINTKVLPKYILTHEKNNNIGLVGYCIGDTPLSYNDLTYDKIISIIRSAEQLADYVIIDASAPLLTEALTASIEMADCLNILVTPNNNGIIYLKTAVGMFSRSTKFAVANTNYILSPTRSFHPVDVIQAGFENIKFNILPYVEELEVQNLNGNLFDAYKHGGKKYRAVVDTIASTFM